MLVVVELLVFNIVEVLVLLVVVLLLFDVVMDVVFSVVVVIVVGMHSWQHAQNQYGWPVAILLPNKYCTHP
jgi:hypothetical protein